MDLDKTALDAEAELPFRLRLRLGDVTPVELPHRIAEVVVELRRRGTAVARRAERVAAVVELLGGRGWRLVGDDLAAGARETVSSSGFAARGGQPLPPAVTVARDARAVEIAGDLAAAFGDDAAQGCLEIAGQTTVRLEGYDLPVRLADGTLVLVYSPRAYLETFSIRG